MFTKSTQDRAGGSLRTTDPITLIAEGASVNGEFHFGGSLEIHGAVNGKIIADDQNNAQIRILNGGYVIGEINVPTVIINGYVKGEIFATAQAKLASKAIVEGNIHYSALEIESGAKVSGNLIYEGPANNVTDLSKGQKGDDKENLSAIDDKA